MGGGTSRRCSGGRQNNEAAKVVRPGRGENHGGKAKELLGGLKKMIETKLGNTKVKGFAPELVADFAVIVRQ